MIATQFGLAMMPRCVAMAPPFTSGTTSGTSASMRNAEELSTTTAPWRTATGAKPRDGAAGREQRDVDAGELPSVHLVGERRVRRSTTLARRPRRGEQAQTRERTRRQAAQQQLDADRARGADNRDRGPRPAQAKRNAVCRSVVGHACLRCWNRETGARMKRPRPSPAGPSVVGLSPNSARKHLRRPTGGRLRGLTLERDMRHPRDHRAIREQKQMRTRRMVRAGPNRRVLAVATGNDAHPGGRDELVW